MAATASETAPSVATRDPELVSSLAARNATFTTLLSLIPSQYYVVPTQEEADSRWMKNKKRKTGEEIKEHKRKVKQEKLDPDNLPGAVDVEIEAEATEETSTSDLPPAVPARYSRLPPAASVSELRERMRAKMETFQKDRNFDPNSRDALEAARRQKRGEMRDRRRKERKEERKKAREDVTAKPAKNQLLVPQLPRGEDDITLPAVALPSSAKGKAPLKRLANPAQALAHLEKHQAKLAALPEDKRKEAEQRDLWAKAEERAKGGKVADEASVLKKAVKREEKRKSKSGQAWAERKKQLEMSQSAAIKKRNDNIASRLQARRDKKSGKSAKDKAAAKKGGKGKGRPGFEGKKKRA